MRTRRIRKGAPTVQISQCYVQNASVVGNFTYQKIAHKILHLFRLSAPFDLLRITICDSVPEVRIRLMPYGGAGSRALVCGEICSADACGHLIC